MAASARPHSTKVTCADRSIRDYASFREYLRDFCTQKRSQSPSWSYSVWARQLGVKSSSTLIMVVNGKRDPGPKLVQKMAKFFAFDAAERLHFEGLVQLEKLSRRSQTNEMQLRQIVEQDPRFGMLLMEQQDFNVRSQWHFYALREMTRLKDFRCDTKWILDRLDGGLTKQQITEAIYTLLDLGLVRRDRRGRLRYHDSHVTTSDDRPDHALKLYHNEVLKVAREKSDATELWEREISGGCFAISTSNIPLAKKMIRRFQRELCEALEQPDADAVYQLEVAFFPLTKSKGPRNDENHAVH